MNIEQIQKIYFVGIGGIGVSAEARIFRALGKTVAGSDLKQSAITDSLQGLGVPVFIGADQQTLENLNSFKPDLIVYTPAAAEFPFPPGIEKIDQGQAVGLLMQGKYGIAVTGTNGKSTTTAILGLILEKANLDPTVLIGSVLSPKNESKEFQANARLGRSQYVVVESDEYAKKMLSNQPQAIVITNIAEDHLDVYKDLQDIKSAFLQYVQALPPDGMVVYNADDHNTVEIARQTHAHKYTFGIDHYADLQAINLNTEHGMQLFDLHLNDELIGRIQLRIPGKFNVSNALGAILIALKLGISFDVIKSAVESFAGIWRRFEVVGTLDGKEIISDYAHHPAGIIGTIKAAKEFYPGKKILVVFQPHHRNRTKQLFGQFVETLEEADDLIIPEIFDVAGREHGESISSQDLVTELKAKQVNAEYAEDLDQAAEMVRSKLDQFDVVLCMGAGDIDLMARSLINGN